MEFFSKTMQETEKPILIPHSPKWLSNEKLAAIVRNVTKKVDSQLDTIHTKF